MSTPVAQVLLPRLTAAEVVQSVELQPVPLGTKVAPQFLRPGDATSAILSDDRDRRMATWPDGCIGYVVFAPNEDRAAALQWVYDLAREDLEALALLHASAEIH